MTLSLMSAAFGDRQTIPQKYTRLGENASPPLRWSGAPPATQSFAVVVDDPDAPNGTFRHWAVYDIPANREGLEDGEADETGLPQARNDFGESGYEGPEPPAGHGPHRYHFKLLALDVPALEVPPEAGVEDVEVAAADHTLARAELVGVFERGSKDM